MPQMWEVRPFAEADRAALPELFLRAGEDAPTASLWGHAESEAAVYLDPYLELHPESVFLAVIDGTLVGYLVGAPDSSSLPTESARMAKAVRRHRLALRRKPALFFARAMVDMAGAAIRRAPTAGDFEDPRWPAHLHINVAPEARGTGVAEGLMSRWLDRLRETGSPGCHLQTLRENTRAVRFFTRMGFVPHGPTPLVPGVREGRERLHQQTMVWNP